MKHFPLIRLIALCLLTLSFSSCWPLLVGAGAAGGYIARDKGVKVQPPVTNDGGGNTY